MHLPALVSSSGKIPWAQIRCHFERMVRVSMVRFLAVDDMEVNLARE